MNKKLLQSVREYKKQSIITPLLVTLEVLMEVLIPLEMAKIIDIGIAEGNLGYIIQRGLILVIMAMMSLFCTGRKLCSNCRSRICQKSAARYLL